MTFPQCVLDIEQQDDGSWAGTITCGDKVVDVFNWRAHTATGRQHATFEADGWLQLYVARLQDVFRS